jgi:hypothetical protein
MKKISQREMAFKLGYSNPDRLGFGHTCSRGTKWPTREKSQALTGGYGVIEIAHIKQDLEGRQRATRCFRAGG